MTAPGRALRESRDTKPASAEPETDIEVTPLATLPIEVPMSELERDEFVKYLDSEIGDHLGSRTDFIDRIIELTKQYRAQKPTTEKNFPFKRASQVTIPIGKMTVNVIAPRITDELLRPDVPWSIRSSHKISALERVANEGEDFLKIYADRRLRYPDKVETMVLEGCKLGTSVWEVAMDQIVRQTARYSDDGTEIVKVDEPVSVGPQIHNIPQEDFVWKFGFTDPQEMPWVGKIVHLTKRQVLDRVRSGKFRPDEAAEMLKKPSTIGIGDSSTRVAEVHEKFERAQPSTRASARFDVFELYVYWPIAVRGDDGKRIKVMADLLVHYSWDARKLLGVRLNPYWHKKRPYLGWAYAPVEYRFNGEGLLEQVEQFQDEITAMHRLRLDNQTLGSMRMIVVSKMVEGLAPGDPLYPGKVIRAQNTSDVVPFQLADIYPSTVLNENLTMAFVERVTGINEATLGRALPVTRTTATAQTSLLEEQSKRFNLTIRRARRVIGQAGEMIYDLFHQFGTNGLATEWMGNERGQIVELLFSIPREQVTTGFTIGIVATSPKVNKQLDMQSNLQLFNLMTSLHQQLLELVQSLGPEFAQQTLPIIARALVSSARRFMFRVLDAFDETDPEGVLQALTLLELILPDASQAFGGKALSEQTLREAIAELRPDLAGEVEGAARAGMADALALVQSTVPAGGANAGPVPAGAPGGQAAAR